MARQTITEQLSLLIMELVLFLVIVFSFHKHFVTTEPVISINDGKVRGKYLSTKGGRSISAFMGIPFAKPPIGPLRFEPPQPVDSWNDILDGTSLHNICPQRNIFVEGTGYEGVEDCLYLNVYTPKTSDFEVDHLPVMVFLHGGGFLCGSGRYDSYAPEVLLDRDVVLVTTNYRLGALGFLTTGDEVVPGNNGLKDQNYALKWVQNNIAQFGGDPGNVTLFGESAGGASAHYHVLSPLSKGLFKSAILQSGTALASWSHAGPTEGYDNSVKLAKLLNCPTTSSEEMVNCLRKADANDILKKDVEFEIWNIDPMIPFKPVTEPNIEGAFLTKDPLDIIFSDEAADVPLIIGVNTDEGVIKTAKLYSSPKLMEEFANNFTTLLPVILQYDKWFSPDVFDTVTQLIDGFYLEYEKIDNSKIKEITDLISDGLMLHPADRAARVHSQHSKQPVYLYLFGYRGQFSYSTILGGGDKDFGVCHMDDLLYLFPTSIFGGGPPSEKDNHMIDILTKLWTNFARTSNPTPEGNNDNLAIWQPYGAQEEYYEFTRDASAKTTLGGFAPDRMSFWRELVSVYGSEAK